MPKTAGPLSISFTDASIAEIMHWIEYTHPNQSRGTVIHLVNAYTLALASQDSGLVAVLRDLNAVNLVDSFWLHKLLASRSDLKHGQIRGPSLFKEAITRAPHVVSARNHFLLGGTEAQAQVIRSILEPFGKWGGSYAPAYGEADIDSCFARISNVEPSVIWVCLGTPKQDFVAQRLNQKFPATYICVGAALDFFTKEKNEAPIWVRSIGMEWAFRFLQEPKRLWKRYLWGNGVFIGLALRYWFQK